MADVLKVMFLGVQELGSRLDLARTFIRSRRMRVILEDAKNTMVAMARKDVPKKSYLLHSKIFGKVENFLSEFPSIVIGTRKSTYAQYVEEGTKPHEIKPRIKRILYWQTAGPRGQKIPTGKGIIGPQGYEVFKNRVRHPGTKPQPYIAPQITRMRPRLIMALQRAMNEMFEGQK